MEKMILNISRIGKFHIQITFGDALLQNDFQFSVLNCAILFMDLFPAKKFFSVSNMQLPLTHMVVGFIPKFYAKIE